MRQLPVSGVSSPLVAAIERAWAGIQARHQDVPSVVVTLGSGTMKSGLTLGHFAAERWVRGGERIHELFVGGEGLARGGAELLGTLLHEAAHGVARARGVQDTSRQGRYHNTRFKLIGEELGLELAIAPGIGWSTTVVPEPTAGLYSPEVNELSRALVAHRLSESRPGGRGTSNNGVSAVCGCGRRIRVARSTFELAPIVCGGCGELFAGDME